VAGIRKGRKSQSCCASIHSGHYCDERVILMRLGGKHTPETIEKMRVVHIGKKHTPETIGKMCGRKHTPEEIAKMRLLATGKKHTAETKEKIRLAKLGKQPLLGHHPAPQTIEKIRLALTGRHLAPEHREKIRLANLRRPGKKHTPEAREKMRIAHLGNSPSPESREKSRLSHLGIGLGRKLTHDTRKRISDAATIRFLKGGMWWLGGGVRGWFYSEKNHRSVHYRSSYELMAFRILDQLTDVVSYEVESFSIPYTDEAGSARRYIPDILVAYCSGRRELIEVSASWQLKEKEPKIKAGRQWCEEHQATFSIWTLRELLEFDASVPGIGRAVKTERGRLN